MDDAQKSNPRWARRPSGGGLSERPKIPYAGFWRRVAAGLIDVLVITIPGILLILVFPFEPWQSFWSAAKVSPPFAFVAIFWAYKALLESSKSQASLGKRALKITVTDLNGSRISLRTATIRGSLIPLILLAFGLPLFLVGFVGPSSAVSFLVLPVFLVELVSCFGVAITTYKQGLHDILTDCLVVRRGFAVSDTAATIREYRYRTISPKALIGCVIGVIVLTVIFSSISFFWLGVVMFMKVIVNLPSMPSR